MRLVMPLYLPLVAFILWGTLAVEVWGHRVLMALGTISVEADGVSAQPGNDAEGLLQDWLICGAGISAPRRAAPGDTTPAPRSSGVVEPGVSELLHQRSRTAHFL
jgi:hypothetical protein